jgi:Na+/proline symporter
MEAVIWVEVVQLAIYIGGAIAAAVVLLNQIDGGMPQVLAIGQQFNKFTLFDFTLDFTKTYTFWAGLIGGCFLTMSTHGTDQYLVQRYLCTNKPSSASLALLSSGAVVLGQFIGFLFIGVLLFAFYAPFNAAEYSAAGVVNSGVPATFPFAGGDKVFPDFITKFMPSGLSGLVIAAIFAAALSSSLNSIAATFVNDLYKPFAKDTSDRHLLKISGWLTLIIGIVQIAVALVVMKQKCCVSADCRREFGHNRFYCSARNRDDNFYVLRRNGSGDLGRSRSIGDLYRWRDRRGGRTFESN